MTTSDLFIVLFVCAAVVTGVLAFSPVFQGVAQ